MNEPGEQPPPRPDEGDLRWEETPGQEWEDPGAGTPWAHGAAPPPPWSGSAGGSGWSSQGPRRGWSRTWVIGAGAAAVLVAGTVGGLVGNAIGAAGKSSASTISSGGISPRPGPGSGYGPGSGRGPGSGSGFAGPPSGGSSSSGGTSGGGSGPADAASIAARVDPDLVDVNTAIDYGQAQGAATGMVLTSDGEVLTNNHVVEGATTIRVTDIGHGQTYSASVIGYDVSKDVAVLRLSGASNLKTVTIASPSQATVGEEVVGIGNAGGTGGTPSYAGGTVTATNRSITASDDLTGTSEQLAGMIETNADIQAGDSGGPLVDHSGAVIGMDTAGSGTFQVASQSGGDGFAIPIDAARSVAGQILAGQSSGTVHVGATAFLGVQIEQANSGAPGGFGSGNEFGGSGNAPAATNGVPIAGVVSGSPAAGAGLASGDVITAVGGHSVTTQSELQAVMANDVKPGQSVTVEYADSSGQQHSVSVVLASGAPE
jgi:S1-C subfamily serine protease